MHGVTQYARRVVDGDILACNWIVLACERHLNDLEREDICFDEDAADHALSFIQSFRHYKGELAGERLHLEPWQVFAVGSIFGWMRVESGLRRFSHAYIAVPRKNGKSTLAAAVGIYMLVADGEPGAEVYSAATKIDQAKIVWNDASVMIKKCGDPAFLAQFQHRKQPSVIEHEDSNSSFRPLSREADNLDGLNPHLAIFDELHACRNPELWNVINSAFGARTQPLFLQITTAGVNTADSICLEQERHVQAVVSGKVEDDSYFGLVYTIDKGDDITNPDTWVKANPNFGVSVREDSFASAYARAKDSPRLLADFKTKRLNQWVSVSDGWLDTLRWSECVDDSVNEDDLLGCYCYAGLDLAQVSDLSAFALLFPPQDEFKKWQLLVRFFAPEASVEERERKSRVPYKVWAEKGHIEVTPGDVTDYRFINRRILEDFKDYDIRLLAFDRTFSHAMIQELQDEAVEVAAFGQGFVSMSTPSKDFERMVIGRELNHFGNPVLDWMAGNVVIKMDPAGNIKPDKSADNSKKVDGIVAAIMALGVALADSELNDAPDCPIDFWG
jgi:phage terminase large subunit-like protein